MASYVGQVGELLQRHLREATLERMVADLRARMRQLEATRSIIVPVQSFGDEPVELIRPFHVVVQPCDGEFTATFFDANFNASGDTEVEAVENLKATMLDALEHYTVLEKIARLGPQPTRQLAVLRQFINLVLR